MNLCNVSLSYLVENTSFLVSTLKSGSTLLTYIYLKVSLSLIISKVLSNHFLSIESSKLSITLFASFKYSSPLT